MKKKFYVNLFGTFQIRLEENGLCRGQKKFTSKETFCLSYLLLNKNMFIAKEELIDVLWGEKESRNPVNALKTLIHRLRQHLNENFGENNYILETSGHYQWNPQLETVIDAEVFKEKIRDAEEERDIDAKTKRYEEAVNLYRGSFMENKHQYTWFVLLGSGYRTQFVKAVKILNELYLQKEEYEKMERLCHRGILYEETNEDFYYYLILAKILLMKFDEALDNYYIAEKFLCTELEVANLERLQGLWSKIVYSEQMHQIEDLRALNQKLEEEDSKGAFLCTYATFREFYRMERRKIYREQSSGKDTASRQRILILFSIEYGDGMQKRVQRDMKIHEKEMELLQEALLKNLRATDIVSRGNHFQFVALLEDCSEQDFKVIESRIRWDVGCKNKDIQIKIEFGDFEKVDY